MSWETLTRGQRLERRNLMNLQRRICWPTPDATCLEGGCSYCDDEPFVALSTINRYVESAGLLPNRGLGEQLAINAWLTGLDHGFFGRAEVRRRLTKEEA